MPRFNPQSLMLPRIVKVRPTVARGNKSANETMVLALSELEGIDKVVPYFIICQKP
jgi:hypothetical protein